MSKQINKSAEAWFLLQKRLGISKVKLASRLGVTYGTIAAWEKQESSPDVKHIQVLNGDGINPLFMMGIDDNHLRPGFTSEQVRENILKAA